jgi:hypothetical protein
LERIDNVSGHHLEITALTQRRRWVFFGFLDSTGALGPRALLDISLEVFAECCRKDKSLEAVIDAEHAVLLFQLVACIKSGMDLVFPVNGVRLLRRLI